MTRPQAQATHVETGLLCAFSAHSREYDDCSRLSVALVGTAALCRPTEIAQRDDVVALQHRRGAMTAKGHDGVRIDSSLNEEAYATSPEVVHDSA
jgi:hypothetical protein